jgi:beta-carotene ketolase (CrtW type)
MSNTFVSSKPRRPNPNRVEEVQSVGIALAIVGLWGITLIFGLLLDITKISKILLGFGVLWQTFLYTGLFITAHDAMHGLVCPQNHKINYFFGSLASLVYALFPYKVLLKKHHLHHNHPASELDPDFHNGQDINFLAWYLHFLKGYWNWTRLGILLIIFNLLGYILGSSLLNLLLFWLLPSLLSSLQLFYFGTFLPHRQPKAGYNNPHRAQSYSLPIFWSLIACYHFGYHREHHENPNLPWWKLPTGVTQLK